MKRDEDVIDLGAASIETRGGKGVLLDQISGQFTAGLSDE